MICPVCQAENPVGTKICVKCGQNLPPEVETKDDSFIKDPYAEKPVTRPKFGLKDMIRDVIDFCWLLLIIFLVFLGFLGEVTHWTFTFTQTEEAQIQKPIIVKPVPSIAENFVPKAIVESPQVAYGNPASLYRKGKRQYDLHHYNTSFNYLRDALEIDPTYAKAYFGLGYLYARFGMDNAAVRMYQMALRFDPDFQDATNNLAMMYFHAGNDDDAVALIQKAISFNDNADCEYNLGSIYLQMNQLDDALQAFSKAIAMKPNDASFYNNMALTYEKLGEKQQAIDAWKKVLEYSDQGDLLEQAKTHINFLQAQS